MKQLLIITTLLLSILHASYIPQMSVTTSAQFFNKQLSVNVGPAVSQFVNKFQAPNFTHEQKVGLVHIKLNMTNITQKLQINWGKNTLQVKDQHTFVINAKNINLTLDSKHFQYHIVTDKIGQHGSLQIKIQNIDVVSSHSFVRNNCSKSIGFGLNINDITIDSTKLKIHVTFKNEKGKQIDKRVIALIEKLVISRGPNLINTKVRQILNQLIYKAACAGMIEQIVPIGQQTYIVSLNTTDVPYFANLKHLTIPLDLNFQNIKTNATNEQVDNQNLVDDHIYEDKADVTASISSNMINTLVWLVDDSKALSFNVTKDMLGPDAPISLDTTGLSILMPGLKKFPGKDVIVRVKTSSEFSQVFIRSGRILSGFSISADFIINDTARIQDLNKCLELKECFVATSLNITLGVSASVRVQKYTYLTGLVQALYVHEIKVIESLIDVKTQNLMKILNPLISSARPQINNILQQGKELNLTDIEPLNKLNLTGIIGQAFLDYASVGLQFDL